MGDVIWLNGAFGVGKTAIARELVCILPRARLVDPERIGYVMKRTFWRRQDFQDVRLWRRLVRRQVTGAARRHTAIVPMTVVRPDVFRELTTGARVFLLTASRRTLEERIGSTPEARAWRTENLPRCLESFAAGGFGEEIDTDGRTPSEVAHEIASRL